MSITLNRRRFLKSTAMGTGALVIGFNLPGALKEARASEAMPNSWVRIASDNTITIECARSEMGQGVFTSLPTLLAEELAVDINSINVEMAPAGEPYINAMLGGQLTGGSTSVRDAYQRLRTAGAQARIVLIQAAADLWGVDAADCTAQNAHVMGPDGKTATYGELAGAASKLVPPKEPALKPAAEFQYVGQPIKRFDTPSKVNGTARFGIDVQVPGMLLATIAQCPVFGGSVKSFDATKAKAMPGVKDVIQISSGVVAVADTYWHAKKALAAVDIQWDEGPASGGSSEAIYADLKMAASEPGALISEVGDTSAAISSAPKKIEALYETSYVAHATMEPMNFTADVKDDSCVLIGPTQFQQLAQGAVAELLGMSPEKVTVETTFLGGGFGRRVNVDFVLQAAEISKAMGAPVKLIWSREEDTQHDVYRPAGALKLIAGLDDNGKPLALHNSHAGQSVTAGMFPAFVKDGIDPFMIEAAVVPYEIPNRKSTVVIHDTVVPIGYWRSVSHNVNAFANESFIDEMAYEAGIDPLSYRRELLAGHTRYLRVLDKAAEMSGWGSDMPQGSGRGVAVLEGYGSYLAMVAEVTVNGKDISLDRVLIAADLGSMINPNIVRQQIESSVIYGMSSVLYDDITLVDGRVTQSNFHDYRVPRMKETPVIDMHLYADGEAPGGIGEPVTALMAPGLANAVFAASGKRLRKLPFSAA